MKSKIEIIERGIGHVIEIEESVLVMQMPKVMGKNFTEI